jgi:hypothetical protein
VPGKPVLALVTIPLGGKEVGTAAGTMLGSLLGERRDPSDSKGRDIPKSTGGATGDTCHIS